MNKIIRALERQQKCAMRRAMVLWRAYYQGRCDHWIETRLRTAFNELIWWTRAVRAVRSKLEAER
jgi:hypothetical protein